MSIQTFTDESGDIGYTKKSSRYFILTTIMTHDPDRLRRTIRDIHRYKLKKNRSSMLHAYKETKQIRDKFVEKARDLKLSCLAVVIDKSLTRVEDPYFHALMKLAQYIKDLKIGNITIARMDTRKSYDKKIVGIFSHYGIQVIFSNPSEEKSLQMADFYSWSIFVSLEHHNSTYFSLLANTITLI